MGADEVSFRVVATGQEFRNLGYWSCVLLQGKNNVRTRIIKSYRPTVSATTGEAYSEELEAAAIKKSKLSKNSILDRS